MEWYNKSAEDALRELNADDQKGLSQQAAEHRLERYGANTLPRKTNDNLTSIILDQCADVLVAGLLLAFICALLSGQFAAAFFFLIAAAARVIPGALQDSRASRNVQSLENFTPDTGRVLRDGHVDMIPAENIVPGDIVVLEAGDIVPADLRLIETVSLQIDEALIDGSTEAVYKDADAVMQGNVPAAERTNIAYAGSAVVYGRGRGVVIATGDKTELGTVAGMLHGITISDSVGDLRNIGQGIGILCIIGWLLLLIFGLARGEVIGLVGQLANFAAASIPAGLAIVTTLTLAITMRRLEKKGIHITRLSSAERLGAVNVICTDKTGTLTENEMTATLIWTGSRFTVIEGSGYAPTGKFYDPDGSEIDPLSRKDIIMAMTAAALCNNAELEESDVDTWKAVGDPTEAALLAMAGKAGIRKDSLDEAFPRLAEIPFDPERRMMTTVHRTARFPMAYTKGAVDDILTRCTGINFGGKRSEMTEKMRDKIREISIAMSDKSLRVLAVAYRDFTKPPKGNSPEDLESELTLIGLIGLLDPTHDDSAAAVESSSHAGIRTVMITGEAASTAAAVAKSTGILKEDAEGGVLTGAEVDEMTDGTLRTFVRTTRVFARVTPQQKARILEAFHRNGDVVALTGDGVADVASLRTADIGVAKGKTGTEIARSAADIVIGDDKFSTLVAAIREGRVMYNNLRAASRYLLTAATSAGIISLFALFARRPLPFPTAGLLLCSLILFALPAFAIGHQSEERDTMARPPRSVGTAPLKWADIIEIGARSVFNLIMSLILFAIAGKSAVNLGGTASVSYASSVIYTLFVFATLFSAFSCRWARTPMTEQGKQADFIAIFASVAVGLIVHIIVAATPIRNWFGLASIGVKGFLLTVLFAVIAVILGELFKLKIMPLLISAVPGMENSPEVFSRIAHKFAPGIQGVTEKLHRKKSDDDDSDEELQEMVELDEVEEKPESEETSESEEAESEVPEEPEEIEAEESEAPVDEILPIEEAPAEEVPAEEKKNDDGIAEGLMSPDDIEEDK